MNQETSHMSQKTAVLLFLSFVACTNVDRAVDKEQPDTIPTPTPQPDLVDSTITPAIAGRDGWNYHREVVLDLDGDGSTERVVLTARVEMIRGRPAWDDGQPWQVYLTQGTDSIRYLYAQRLQLGSLDMRVAREDSASTVLLIEHLPDRLRLLEIVGGPSVRLLVERTLDPRGELASPRLP
jgi:hypothetical protein